MESKTYDGVIEMLGEKLTLDIGRFRADIEEARRSNDTEGVSVFEGALGEAQRIRAYLRVLVGEVES